MCLPDVAVPQAVPRIEGCHDSRCGGSQWRFVPMIWIVLLCSCASLHYEVKLDLSSVPISSRPEITGAYLPQLTNKGRTLPLLRRSHPDHISGIVIETVGQYMVYEQRRE